MRMEPRDMRTIGGRISARREAAGLSQEQLARASKINQSNLSALERNKRRPSVATLEKLARAFRCRVGDLTDPPRAA
jgi:transcriptional regulator with XRE-family HTH domain